MYDYCRNSILKIIMKERIVGYTYILYFVCVLRKTTLEGNRGEGEKNQYLMKIFLFINLLTDFSFQPDHLMKFDNHRFPYFITGSRKLTMTTFKYC